MTANENPTLDTEVERHSAMTVVHCSGQVDVDTAAKFSETIRSLIPEGKSIRVELGNVTRVDSIGIGAFVAIWAAAKRRNCDLKYINPNKPVEDVMRICALLGMLEGHEMEERQLTASLSPQ